MNKTQPVYFGLLVSAILLAGLIVIKIQGQLPRADAALLAIQDNFTFLTAKTRTNEEALFVIDNINEKLLIYTTTLRGNGGRMELARIEDLGRIFETDTGGPRKPERPRP